MTSFYELVGRTEIMVLGLAVAVFLAFYWLVRGSPIGQGAPYEGDNSTSPGYRDRAAALAVFGLICVFAGAYIAADFGILWSIVPFGLGYAILLRTVSKNRQYRHVSPMLRRTVEFAQTSLTATLLAGVLLIVNIFAFKYGGKPLDFTHDEAFTLSSMSVNQLEKLDRPLKFTMVLGKDPAAARNRERLRQLIELYKGLNPSKIEVKELASFDPSQASDFETILKRVPDLAITRGDSIVLEYGEAETAARMIIPVQDLFRIDNSNGPTGDPRASSIFSGEDAITSAIYRFMEGKRVVIGFTTGHGEPPLDLLDTRELGLGVWKSRLTSLGMDAVEVSLLKEDVSANVSLVVVVWPKTAFLQAEADRLKSFLAAGKPMLFVMNAQTQGGLESLLLLHNISFGPGRIVDPVRNMARRVEQIFTDPRTNVAHPIISSAEQASFFFPSSSPLRAIGAANQPNMPSDARVQSNPAIIVAPFLRSSPTSWAEMKESEAAFEQGVDVKGPLVVGLAATERVEPIDEAKPKPRLVVFSSPYVGVNPSLAADPSNLDLLINSIEWLKGKEQLLGVAPKIHKSMRFIADTNLKIKLHLIPTVVSVVLILGFAVTLYLARRA